MTLYEDRAPLATATLTLKPACAAKLVLSPDNVTLATGGKLPQDVGVTAADVRATCGPPR